MKEENYVGKKFDVDWEDGVKMGNNWFSVECVSVRLFTDGEWRAFFKGYPMCPVNVKHLKPEGSLPNKLKEFLEERA